MSFTMKTPFGEQPFTPELLADLLDTARELEDQFVILERDADGAFIQFDGVDLEFGREGALHRYDTASVAKAAFERFLEGDDLRGAPGWRDVSTEIETKREQRRRSLRNGLILTILAAAILAYAWWRIQAVS